MAYETPASILKFSPRNTEYCGKSHNLGDQEFGKLVSVYLSSGMGNWASRSGYWGPNASLVFGLTSELAITGKKAHARYIPPKGRPISYRERLILQSLFRPKARMLQELLKTEPSAMTASAAGALGLVFYLIFKRNETYCAVRKPWNVLTSLKKRLT
jgi:hypothetical protein